MSIYEPLLDFFKTLADENRLRIVGLLSEREYSVGELSEALAITEPTVSHHLNKLRRLGLVNLRTNGTYRLYRLNDAMLQRYKQAVLQMEQLRPSEPPTPPDQSWIDELGLDEEGRKVLLDYTVGQRLKFIPARVKKLQPVLIWLSTRFEIGRSYTEREVNAVLTAHHEDYARLRRDLIEAGYLARERDGRQYWRVR